MVESKPRIVDDALLTELGTRYGTPLYVQDGSMVAGQVAKLSGFDVVRYAMKANSNLSLLREIRSTGAHVDCVSEGELERARRAGWTTDQINFTADLFSRRTLERVAAEGVMVNLGSPDMIEQYAERAERRDVTLRINPGFGHGHSQKVNTGGPRSKHGIWHEELADCVGRARRAGLEVTGLHMHIGSGTDLEHLRRVAAAMEEFAEVVGNTLRTISGGGGLPTPYRASEPQLDVAPLVRVWHETRNRIQERIGHPLTLEVEPGRFIVAEGGLLLTEVRGNKTMDGMPCILVDAGFNTLCRPMIYGAHHQISLVGRDAEVRQETLVAGPLCESSDVFTQGPGGEPSPQMLPPARVGDLLCIHDTGAYGASMASNYNSMRIPAEVLIVDGVAKLSRSRQTADELLLNELDASEVTPTEGA